ncbi:MAG: methylmalonyl Co-A mutase-associated GTPase MeaB [Anaerolineales bacterium]|nr:methylmalonyl Co-A mutase-associated GTPase MeaB [Anaerolineales bacterium]
MTSTDPILQGDRLALARLLTQIENETPEGLKTLGALYPHTGQAHLVGITGAPGTGKSTLVNQLALHLRKQPMPGEDAPPRVGVVAVDPSSPFSGGAILGDRIRMRDLAGDPGVFIRSMASRGALGGLARATAAVGLALDAAGFQIILIETVGAGQAEVDIASNAHTTVVIEAPSMGDAIQANKAGILEIADILVVNKADIPGADNTVAMLRFTLEMASSAKAPVAVEIRARGEGDRSWEIPVLETVATKGEGIPDLVEMIYAHKKYLTTSGGWELREGNRVRSQMESRLRDELVKRFLKGRPDGRFEDTVQMVVDRELSPAQAIEELLKGEKS